VARHIPAQDIEKHLLMLQLACDQMVAMPDSTSISLFEMDRNLEIQEDVRRAPRMLIKAI
jgi:hypothetical protein